MRGPFTVPPELYESPRPAPRWPSWFAARRDPVVVWFMFECLVMLPFVWLLATTLDALQLDLRASDR